MHNKDLRKNVDMMKKIKENYEFHEDAQGLRLKNNLRVGKFYKIFGDGFWGSFINILCGFQDCLYGKNNCWDFDFQVSEIFIALVFGFIYRHPLGI
jgi:hypothetical protein